MNDVFSRRAVLIISCVMVTSLATAIIAGSVGRPAPPESANADSFSTSALGHHALYAILRKLRMPVTVSRYDTPGRAADTAFVVVAEPWLSDEDIEDGAKVELLNELLDAGSSSLLVLPKRWGPRSARDERHIDGHALLATSNVDAVLTGASFEGSVRRGGEVGPNTFTDNAFSYTPTIRDLQLLAPDMIEPLISGPQGILLGSVGSEDSWGHEVYILSDPDLISTHGLADGDNAVLIVEILNRISGGGPIIIDETIHGYKRVPSLYERLSTFPLVLVVVQCLLAVGLLMWAGVRRFGRPRPTAPPFEPGKTFLIENTARLLVYGDNGASALDDYLTTNIRRVAARLKAPRDLEGRELHAWLDKLGARLGATVSIGEVSLAVDDILAARRRPAQRALELAMNIHTWREEMLHGAQ